MKLGAYELIYLVGQKPILGKPFRAYDYSDIHQSQYRELLAFESFCQNKIWSEYDLSGLFSPQFFDKTGINSHSFESFIFENPGYELYLYHPYPLELSIQNSFLDLAELEHPGITELLSWIWHKIYGENLPQINLPISRHICCHCNYILATPKFWAAYNIYVSSFMDLLRSDEDCMMTRLTPYNLSRTTDTSLPISVFAFERSLSHFIHQFIEPTKVINYAYSQNNWVPNELFQNEIQFVQELQMKYHMGETEELNIHKNNILATEAYYRFRRSQSIK